MPALIGNFRAGIVVLRLGLAIPAISPTAKAQAGLKVGT